MSKDIVKCPVRGCNKKLDSDNVPIEYCDYQQGRCPMYKAEFTLYGTLIYVLIFVLLFGVIWLTI